MVLHFFSTYTLTGECLGEEFDICIVKLHTVHLSKEGCSHTQCRCFFFSNCFHNAFYSTRNQKNHLISTFYNTCYYCRESSNTINKVILPDAQEEDHISFDDIAV